MRFVPFLSGETPDFAGRYLADIWGFDDSQIETTHDFIQLIFPLIEPSNSSFHGAHLSLTEAQEARGRYDVQLNLKRSADWFLGFLERSTAWKGRYNHNQLRITRVIKSLRLLLSDEAADLFRARVLQIAGSDILINPKALSFWENA